MQEMGMSHSVLYRRVNAITGKGITDFIRFVRLNKAMDMLKEGKKSVADVSTSTGFSSAKYFSTCFKAEFGVRPTDVTNGMSRRAG
ncbi:MAG: helix-turn-helix transcriptional regulator [Bacteroidia bacterium]|nr:helix-turn-helix transcriptional regulator [Bacteroidia bacterium]